MRTQQYRQVLRLVIFGRRFYANLITNTHFSVHVLERTTQTQGENANSTQKGSLPLQEFEPRTMNDNHSATVEHNDLGCGMNECVELSQQQCFVSYFNFIHFDFYKIHDLDGVAGNKEILKSSFVTDKGFNLQKTLLSVNSEYINNKKHKYSII